MGIFFQKQKKAGSKNKNHHILYRHKIIFNVKLHDIIFKPIYCNKIIFNVEI